MKFIYALLFSFIISISFAQSKRVRKSERLFNKGKYEKCIEKSRKFLKKERRSADLQYYIVQSQWALYQQADDSRKTVLLKRTLKSWEKLIQYNPSQNDYSVLKHSLRESIYLDLNSSGIQRAKDYYHHYLAEIFYDTSAYYRSVYNPTEVDVIEQQILGPVLDSVHFSNHNRRKLINEATEMIGVKYKYGGMDATGFDCSGFTQYLYKSIGIDLPHNAQLQSELGKRVSLQEAKAGDLIFFGSKNNIGHAGMIVQNNNGDIELIHCASRGVTYQKSDDVNTIYWLQRIIRIQRLIRDEE